MDISTVQRPESFPADHYTQEKGRTIAEAFANGEALRSICEGLPGFLPSMLEVRRWRSLFPAFDLMMLDAGACRAENMAEDILNIADDDSRQASHNRNRMAAREKLAGWLSPASYGTGPGKDARETDSAPVYALTDEQLLAIAAGKLAPAIDGECERVGGRGVHPPTASAPGIEYEVSGPRKPESSQAEDSVTTNELTQEEAFDAVADSLELAGEFKQAKIARENGTNKVLPPESDSENKILKPGDTDRRSFVGMD